MKVVTLAESIVWKCSTQ